MATKNEILTLLKTIKQDYQNFGLSKIGLSAVMLKILIGKIAILT